VVSRGAGTGGGGLSVCGTNWPEAGSKANTSPVSILYTHPCSFSSPRASPAATAGCVRRFSN
jgi:hypothetical protein